MLYDPWQVKFLETKGDKILCKGRQVGASEVAAADAGEYMNENPDTEPVLMIAPTERQAHGLFVKTLNYIADKYPKDLIIKGKDAPTKTRLVLKSGPELYCLPVGKTGLGVRFLTIGRIYKDECSRIPELVHEAIDPALLTTGGDEILLSTPFGAIGTFHDVWINKDGAYDSFTRFDLDNPITSERIMKERKICDTWTLKQREKALIKLEQAKSRWSKRRYAQEYLGEFVEGLVRWFGDKWIDEVCILKRRGTILPGRKYYCGMDLARMGEDEGSFEIADKMDGMIEQVENIVTKKRFATETQDRLIQLDNQYNFKKVWLDAGSGSMGVVILDYMLRVDSLKRKVEAIDNKKRILDREGKKTVKIMKEDLYENLRALGEQRKIKLLDDDDLRASLSSVQYEYVMKEGEPTKLRIFGNYTHIVEGIIRMAWCAKDKSLNPFIDYI